MVNQYVSVYISLQTPGPGNYSTTHPSIYKSKPPGYSMTSRNPMPGDGTTKPGPGAHSPEKVSANYNVHIMKSAILWTFQKRSTWFSISILHV